MMKIEEAVEIIGFIGYRETIRYYGGRYFAVRIYGNDCEGYGAICEITQKVMELGEENIRSIIPSDRKKPFPIEIRYKAVAKDLILEERINEEIAEIVEKA